MSTLSSSSVDLADQHFGDRGETIIILHGLLGSGRNWTTIAKRLAQTHRVITLDLRNHGASPWSDDMSYPLMAADVRAYIEHHALGPVTVIGHSMGGKTAMRLALDAPSIVDRLVVVDIAPVDYDHGSEAYVEAMRAIPVGETTVRREIDEALAVSVPEAEVRAFLLQNLVREDHGFAWRPHLDALAEAMPTLMAFPTGDHDHFRGPTLFIAGAESDYRLTAYRADIDRLFGRAEIRVIADAGHWVHAQQPTAFLAHLQDFLVGGDSS